MINKGFFPTRRAVSLQTPDQRRREENDRFIRETIEREKQKALEKIRKDADEITRRMFGDVDKGKDSGQKGSKEK